MLLSVLLIAVLALIPSPAYAICLGLDSCDCNRNSKKYSEFYERLRAGERQEALSILEECLQNCWSKKALHEDAAILNLAQHDPELAMPRIERAIASSAARKTDASFDYFLQGLAYLEKGERESAQASFANAVNAARKAGQKQIAFNTYRISLDLVGKLDKSSLETVIPELEDAIAPPEVNASWAWRLMYLSGISVIGAMVLGALLLVYKILPIHNRVETCPVERLATAGQVILDLGYAGTVVLHRGAPDFEEIINNLTDEKKPSSDDYAFDTLLFRVGARTYTIEVSTDGWNFKNEPRNSRRLRDPLQVTSRIISLATQKRGDAPRKNA